jgi:hypothetical protein
MILNMDSGIPLVSKMLISALYNRTGHKHQSRSFLSRCCISSGKLELTKALRVAESSRLKSRGKCCSRLFRDL